MATNVINIREFVDVTTTVADSGSSVSRDWGAFLFVQKGEAESATTIVKYDNLSAVIEGAGSNSEAAKAAATFYGTAYTGVVPSAPFYVATMDCSSDVFEDNFAALLTSEDYYLIALDQGITVAQRKAAADIAQASNSTAAHMLFLDDNSATAVDTDLDTDVALGTSMSLSAYCKNKNYQHVVVAWSNPNNEEKYYSAGMASFYATRKFDSSARQMCSIAHKKASGLSPVDLMDSGLSTTVSSTQKFKNLDGKNGNIYANIKVVGLPAWERGNLPSGDDVSDFIAADYLNYILSVSVFQLLQSTPRLAMNESGATLLANVISLAFEQLASAGVIAGGTSIDGEVFPTSGYKYSIPIPTGVAKANGLWEGIVCSALLAGSAKKIVIGNDLKK